MSTSPSSSFSEVSERAAPPLRGGGGQLLSQDEINALLSAIAAEGASDEALPALGAGAGRRVKSYDFRRPDKLSKDQLRTLQMMHEGFARLLQTSLSAYLRAMVEVEVASVEQMTYEEFSRLLSQPTILSVFSLPPLEGSAVLEIDSEIGFAIIDRLLGGPGSVPARIRELTDIEQTVIRRIVARSMDNLTQAWSQVATIHPHFERLELNPQFTQLVPPNEMVVVIALDLKLRDVVGRMNLCLPYLLLEPIVSKLTTHYWFSASRRQPTPENRAALSRRVSELYLSLSVILGTSDVRVRDLLELTPGDVIQLDAPVGGLLPVRLAGRTKFWARPGRIGQRLAVEIVRAEEGEGFGE
ncbi:MAG TPA: flagellar motor switch protein FliM [Limnochordia bacterium]